ncbi:PAS domain S-box protein [Pseudoxanthomonas wuyuanensis]|uniref:histidine kinase n=2 Tax=Pseudoxanthomonas wuyuanensis TaxID=1073196 RepID=A0A286DA58_9GAMM|nr:PAS domain S-box protein [Pseudoxanthomonas wuyuanensis]SOD55530.1 hypothetical protein SAMN06296416_107171 [Pseudoxanthomonas wuyuanensis]
MVLFPQLFETVPDALLVVDRDGRIVLANQQAERLFGYPRQGLDGVAVEQLMPEAVRRRHHAHRSGYMAAPRIRPMGDGGMALVGQRKDGEQFPVEIALSPLQTDDGMQYLASIRDISETQRARQALARARYDALVARIGQQALESANEGKLIVGLPAQLAEAIGVETVAVLFKRQDGKLEVHAGVGLEQCPLGTANVPEKWRVATAQTLVLEDLAQDAGNLPCVRTAHGSAAVVPLLDHDRPMGALLAWSGQTRRFDHDALHLLQSVANLLAALMLRRRTEEQLAHAQRLDAIGQLTGGVAHDFNNLLTVMSGSLQLLEAECGQQPGALELIASALRSVERGAELTSKLLAFARKQRLSPSAIAPAQLLRDLELMLQRTLGESIRLKVECPATLPAAYADAAQLDAALLNLALNARDAMPRGGEISIAVEERWIGTDTARPHLRAGHYVMFSVTDTGLGMTQETLARAIEPFYTTKGLGRGSGLGLSMVYGFIEQSGGQMEIASRLGYGTRIDLYLPVARLPYEPPQARPASTGGGETVLVVEDEPEVRGVAEAFLGSVGYRVLTAADADGAMARLASEADIALLFSDVMLGAGLNGKELAHAARQLNPALAVLLTSGYEDAPGDDGRDGFELLRKPYRREQLLAAVRRSLDQAAARP